MPRHLTSGEYGGDLRVDGRDRSYLVHLPPAYAARQSLPLVIVLHGGGGNARSAVRMTGMSTKADTEGFIVAYPNGSGWHHNRLLTWNAGRIGYAVDHHIDDVWFLSTLIAHLRAVYPIESTRIYVTGISNGARMAYQVGRALSETIAAIAPVAGTFDTTQPAPEHPVSVIAFHGTADHYAPYAGGVPTQGRRPHERVTVPIAAVMAFWVEHNDCARTPQRQAQGPILQETYPDGRAGTAVTLYTIQGGGHAWPGGQKGRAEGDEPTQALSATDVMWDFFVRHPKNNGKDAGQTHSSER